MDELFEEMYAGLHDYALLRPAGPRLCLEWIVNDLFALPALEEQLAPLRPHTP